MDKVILDTNVVIGLLKGNKKLVKAIEPVPEWYLPVAVVGELLYGIGLVWCLYNQMTPNEIIIALLYQNLIPFLNT